MSRIVLRMIDFELHLSSRRELAGHDRHAGLDQRLDGDAGALVLGEDRVDHGIGDGIRHLVRMAFGDRLGGEEVVVRHRFMSVALSRF